MTGEVYEMLWDCPSCGSKKLLGKTHRFCPGCGGPQDASKRYFPSDAEKILAKDSEYFGADRLCSYCKNATSAKARFCGGCGASLEGSAEAPRVGEAKPQEQPSRSRSWKWLWLPAVALPMILVPFLWKKSASLTVSSHSWEREIPVERFQEVREESWCDSMPSDARRVSRTRKVRSHETVQDGEDCRTVRKDRGDGTYEEDQECTPRTHEEPVYDYECGYTVDRWVRVRSEKSSGSLPEEPSWPGVRLAHQEREGARSEAHHLGFESGGKTLSCTLKDGQAWQEFQPGSRWKGKVRVLTGGLDCGSLQAAP